jgi:hypothetical protein
MSKTDEADHEHWAKDRAYLLAILREIRQSLIKYQRDSEAILFRESHKCRRLCEEALAKVKG